MRAAVFLRRAVPGVRVPRAPAPAALRPLHSEPVGDINPARARAYEPRAIEQKWQARWAQNPPPDVADEPASKPKFYALSMFPYPSGNLHMGHVRVYTFSDCTARVQRMRGFRVLHPMGWDSFGLPAENAAIERGVPASEWTHSNIRHMRAQLASLGFAFDWQRELSTCDPAYYRWTQWLFLEMFTRGLAYQKEATVNWDPVDNTVLANEQVDGAGRSWRSGALVERRQLRQWFLRITAFAKPLLDGLDGLAWPEGVKAMQREWIGRSQGAAIAFSLRAPAGDLAPLRVFTTRPDTLCGVTFLAVAPEHPLLVSDAIPPERRAAVAQFVRDSMRASELDRKQGRGGALVAGIDTGVRCAHPLTGEDVPVFAAPYVLWGYGEGAVMGVPAHDARDFEFARHNGLAVRPVLKPAGSEAAELPFCEQEGAVAAGCGFGLDGLSARAAADKIVAMAAEGGWGAPAEQHRLRDWLVSRQRYWGAPIPIIHCDRCKAVPVPESDLPVLLPEGVALSGRNGSPLAQLPDWVNTKCPCCGGPARRETDTMDTFVDSSWYFLRFCDAQNATRPFDPARLASLMPVDAYIGGIEHAILHLLYARFITKFVASLGFTVGDGEEPFRTLITQGMVHGRTFKSSVSGRYLKPGEVRTDGEAVIEVATDKQVETVWEKMSKSKYNGVDPKDMVDKFGADAVRAGMLFKAPPDHVLEWDEASVGGVMRWIGRLHSLVLEYTDALRGNVPADAAMPGGDRERAVMELRAATYSAIDIVTSALAVDRNFNTAVSEAMKLTIAIRAAMPNLAVDCHPVLDEAFDVMCRLVAPMTPHVASEMWSLLQEAKGRTVDVRRFEPGVGPESTVGDVHCQLWPTFDKSARAVILAKVSVMVQGKLRGVIEVPKDISPAELEKRALSDPRIQKVLVGKKVKKIIVPSGTKVVSIVLE